MRILFLSHYFPPEVNAPASRTYEHCKHWVKSGHQVTVVTCAPNHPQGEVYEGYRNKLYQREQKDGIQVIRLWTYVTANEGFVKRTLNYVSFMISTILAAPFLAKTDVVITTSPQFFNGLAGYAVSRLKRTPWVLEIRDLWPESILTVGAIKNKYIINALHYLELFAYRKANLIVPVTDAFKRYMIEKGIVPDKIHVVKNGVDLDFYTLQSANTEKTLLVHEKNRETPEQIDLTGKFVASYVGTHGMAHHLETVLEAAQLLKDQHNIVFLLAGDGAERAKLLKQKEQMQLDNVLMLEQQPKDSMPMLWQVSDVSMVLLKKSDLFKTVIPSKIFESLAMKKPIIIGVEGEAKSIIEAANAGICIEPENAQQLADATMELYNNPQQFNQFAENGRTYVESYFNRTKLAENYLTLLVKNTTSAN